MFDRELMILGLRKQRNLLDDLIEKLESKPGFDDYDCYLYDERTQKVLTNLKKLRRIKEAYLRLPTSSFF